MELVGNVNLQCESTGGMAVATRTDQIISTSVQWIEVVYEMRQQEVYKFIPDDQEWFIAG